MNSLPCYFVASWRLNYTLEHHIIVISMLLTVFTVTVSEHNFNVIITRRFKDVLTTSVNSRRPSIHKRLATPLFWMVFFRDNFVIFRCRSKRIAFLGISFSKRVYMQIFYFHDGHVTTFPHPSEAYICQMPGHRLSRLAKGTPPESRLSIGTLVCGKTIYCRLCAGQSKGTPKTQKNAVFGSGPAHVTKFWNFSQ